MMMIKSDHQKWSHYKIYNQQHPLKKSQVTKRVSIQFNLVLKNK